MMEMIQMGMAEINLVRQNQVMDELAIVLVFEVFCVEMELQTLENSEMMEEQLEEMVVVQPEHQKLVGNETQIHLITAI